jgi:hypothetical protein
LQVLILLGVLLFVVAAITLLKIIKHTIAAIFSIIGLFLILVAATGFLVYTDVMSIKDNVLSKPSLILLEGNNSVIVAGLIVEPDIQPIEKGVIFLNKGQIEKIKETLKTKKPNELVKETKEIEPKLEDELFKVIIFKEKFIDNSPIQKINLQAMEVDKKDIIVLLNSNSLYYELATEIVDEGSLTSMPLPFDITDEDKAEIAEGIKDSLKEFASDEEQAKSMMFALSVAAVFQEEKENTVKYVFSEFQKGNIAIYPDSITFSILRLAPQSIVTQVIEQLKN